MNHATHPERIEDAFGIHWTLSRLGPLALRASADEPPSAALSARIHAIRAHAWTHRPPGLRDLIPGYCTLTAELHPGHAPRVIARTLHTAIMHGVDHASNAREEVFPVVLAENAELEAALGIPMHEIHARFMRGRYPVAFLGFTPGYPYLHGLDAALTLPRKRKPEPVAAGAVAIADGRAGIYPKASPGGWWVIGHTATPLFDPWQATPTALQPGDVVRFTNIEAAPPTQSVHRATSTAPVLTARDEPFVEVLQVWPGGASLQGRPRPFVGHWGMAQAGALDPRAHQAASHLAGADPNHPSLELVIPHATLQARASTVAATAGGGARLTLDGRHVPVGQAFLWREGATLEIRPHPSTPGATLALAIGGGLKPADGHVGAPSLVGDGSTDVRAGVGGFGRHLQSGDTLARASTPRPPNPHWRGRLRAASTVALRLHPGLPGERALYAELLGLQYQLRTRDRMGVRLRGPALTPASPDIASEAMPWGAVQIPSDGQPIVLLADRGRTGGYALAGVVDARDLPLLAQAQPGDTVTFTVPSAR